MRSSTRFLSSWITEKRELTPTSEISVRVETFTRRHDLKEITPRQQRREKLKCRVILCPVAYYSHMSHVFNYTFI